MEAFFVSMHLFFFGKHLNLTDFL